MLYCATDVGDNGRIVALIIGVSDSIKATRSSIPNDFIHMRRIARNTRQDNILENLSARGDILMICFRINRPDIIRKLLKKKLSKVGRSTKRNINKYFNYALVKEIENKISSYLIAHKVSIKELIIEADTDMEKTLKNTGLKTTKPNIAHSLADIIAWTNTNNRNHKDIREVDLTDKIENSVLIRLS